jgi:ketosteroid isomerase-like protein
LKIPDDPAAVVQRQLDAYNARDINRLMATYAEDAQQFEHPDTLLADGEAQLILARENETPDGVRSGSRIPEETTVSTKMRLLLVIMKVRANSITGKLAIYALVSDNGTSNKIKDQLWHN